MSDQDQAQGRCRPAAPLWLLGALLLLSACSSQAPQPHLDAPVLSWEQRKQQLTPIERWSVLGKISIRTPDDTTSANLNWSQNRDHYRIYMAGPLGQGAVNIEGSDRLGTTLDISGERYRAASPEALLQQQLGWAVPVTQIPYWIRGLPAPEQPHIKVLDHYNQLEQLHQNGWTIRYLGYQPSVTTGSDTADSSLQAQLPRKIELKHGDQLRLLLVLKQWQIGQLVSATEP